MSAPLQIRSICALALIALLPPCAAQTPPDLYDDSVLRTFELRFAQPNWWTLLEQNKPAEQEIPADLVVDGRVYPGVGVRFKGRSSYIATRNSLKRPFRIVVDFTIPGLELYGYSTLNLNNGFRDPTFLREVVGYRMLRRYTPAPKANWVELKINGESWGVYMNVQHVNKDFMDEWLASNDGHRFKLSRPGNVSANVAALNWLGSEPALYQGIYELKSNTPAAWNALVALCDALDNSPAGQLEARLTPHLHIDRALWFVALNNLMVGLDSYIGTANNYYLVQDEVHQRFSVISWDLNDSFGSFWLSTPGVPSNLDPLYREQTRTRPLVSSLLSEPHWRARYLAHYRTALQEAWDWNTVGSWIAQYQSLLGPAIAADKVKLYSTALFWSNVTQATVIGTVVIPGLEPLVKARRAFLEAHPELSVPQPSIGNVTHTPAQPTPTTPVHVTATVTPATTTAPPVVELHARVIGSYVRLPMYDDGQHGDGAAGDGVYGESIPPQAAGATVSYFVTAHDANGAMRVAPSGGADGAHEYTVTATPTGNSLRINELMADNTSTIADPAGDYDDWLELHNPTTAPIDAAGMYLTDDPAQPTRWQLPSGTLVPPGAHLLIWADAEPWQGPLHAPFRLGAGGETVALYDTDGTTLLDQITFGPQVADASTGRLPDGAPLWVTLLDPSPTAANAVPVCGSLAFTARDATAQQGLLTLTSTPSIGGNIDIFLAGLPAASPTAIVIGGGAAHLPLPGSASMLLLAAPMATALTQTSSVLGTLAQSVPIPDDPALVGLRIAVQAVSVLPSGPAASSAVWFDICG